MSRFSTKAFHFELPGGEWVEKTVHLYHARNDDTTLLSITREERADEPGSRLEAALRALPDNDVLEADHVRTCVSRAGNLEAHELALVLRTRDSATYMRIASVGYYDREIRFHWSGPAEAEEAIDARVDRTLETMRFRSR